MHMLYNSDSYVVVRFDVPNGERETAASSNPVSEPASRGGYEIVDKFARKEIFIDGIMAKSFQEGVQALIETDPSEEEMDAYIERYTSLMQHPVVMH